MLIADICQRTPYCADRQEAVHVAADRMRHRAVGSLIVVDSSRRPVGIVTDRDLVVRALATNRDPRYVTLAEVMTPHPTVIRNDAAIEEAVDAMRNARCRRLPVVDSRGQLFGIVSLDDVFLHYRKEIDRLADLVALEITGSGASASVGSTG